MRNGGYGGVMFLGLRRHHDRAAVQGQAHHLRPNRGIDMFVDTDHPRLSDEQSGVAGRPAGVCGARHWVASDVAIQQIGGMYLLQHRTLDADDVGEGTAAGKLFDAWEQACDSGHRDGQDDQRFALRGPRQCLGQVARGGEAVGAGTPCTLRRAVVAECLAARRYRCAQYRPTDQAEPEHADGSLHHAFQVGTPMCGFAGELVKRPAQRLP